MTGTDSRQRVDLYEQMTRAAAERGWVRCSAVRSRLMASFARNILEGLENQMANMTTAAADMLKSARNTAVGVAD